MFNSDSRNPASSPQALNALTAQKTLIVIAHRLSIVQSASQILVLNQGQLVQQGNHRSLVHQDGIYRQFWQAQQQAKTWKLAFL